MDVSILDFDKIFSITCNIYFRFLDKAHMAMCFELNIGKPDKSEQLKLFQRRRFVIKIGLKWKLIYSRSL